VVDFVHILSEDNVADGLTKPLVEARHWEFVRQLGLA
jgi:hypothetical protein